MSWLRGSSLWRARAEARPDPEPGACYTSFCRHWQQAYEVMCRPQPQQQHDDVLSVVNHLEQLCPLLVLEARARPSAPDCLEHLLSENLLDKLYEWASCTGKYENAVRLEQLKLYGCLVTHYGSQVIAAEPFLRPLLKLLSGFRNQLPPPNVENGLVSVLLQLCVRLLQAPRLLHLFFLTAHQRPGDKAEFIIARLLLSWVHRGGTAGAQSRDALLLCAKMSAICEPLAHYLTESNACHVLATGLSGLYSLLPRRLPPGAPRLSPDDVIACDKLTLFVDSIEFCDAVAQVAHPSIKKHLVDLLYQGFLVPVMGPALLQSRADSQSGAAEQAAATAHLELLARGLSPDGLLRTVLHFVLLYRYDGHRVIDVLLDRIEGDGQLSLVALSLMETLIDLNCEDVMLELIYKYIVSGQHLMTSHRHRITDPEPYRQAALAFLALTPNCCTRPLEMTKRFVDDLALSGRRVLDYKQEDDQRVGNGSDGIAMDNLVQEVKFNYGNPNEILIGNYHAYLCDARFEIATRTMACRNWTSKYDRVGATKREPNNNTSKDTKEMDVSQSHTKEQDSIISVCTSGYETLKTSDTSEKEHHSLNSLVEDIEDAKTVANGVQLDSNKEHDSLTSNGDSCGYDSLRHENEEECFAEEYFLKSIRKVEVSQGFEGDVPAVRSWRASAETIIGPLLSHLLRKAALLLESNVSVNCRVTSLISKLCSFPTPLMTSLLLGTGFVAQPNVPSLFQILSKLKEEVDEVWLSSAEGGALIDKARVYWLRRGTHDGPGPRPGDPHRPDAKRRSLSNSFSTMFGRSSKHAASPSRTSPQSSTAHNHSPQITKRPVFTEESYWNQSIALRSILNAVILDEWVKELAALAEEHALRLSVNAEDNSYLKSVAL